MLRIHLSRQRYFLLIFLVCGSLLGGVTYVIYRQSEMIDNYNSWVTHSYEVLRISRRITTRAIDMETGQRGFFLSRKERFLQPYHDAKKYIDEELKALSELVSDNPIQQERLELIGATVTELKNLLDAQLVHFRKYGASMMSVSDLENERAVMQKLRRQLDDLSEHERDLLKAREASVRSSKNQYLFTLFAGSLISIGGLFAANAVIFNLLQRRRATEAKLRESEELVSLVMKGVGDGIFDYDVTKQEMHFSENCLRMLGYAPGEMPPSLASYNQLLHPDDYQPTWDAIHRYFHKETPSFSATYRMLHKNGQYIWILSRGIGEWAQDGEIRRLIAAHTDITEQKENEEQLKALNAEMESFTYIASHDLRAPLVNLKGFAGEISYALQESMPILQPLIADLPEQESRILQEALLNDIPESLNFINSSVEKMDKLTTAILDLSRIGRREFRPQAIAVKALVQRCLDSLNYEITAKKIDIICGDLPDVVADAIGLEQVFSNVLDNAVKYMRSNAASMIRIESEQINHETRFAIHDTGRGIALHDYNKVFDVFRRAGNSGDVRGAGLGMAYVKATLRRMGGHIWFTSVLNEGTTFYFTLPLTPPISEGIA